MPDVLRSTRKDIDDAQNFGAAIAAMASIPDETEADLPSFRGRQGRQHMVAQLLFAALVSRAARFDGDGTRYRQPAHSCMLSLIQRLQP